MWYAMCRKCNKTDAILDYYIQIKTSRPKAKSWIASPRKGR